MNFLLKKVSLMLAMLSFFLFSFCSISVAKDFIKTEEYIAEEILKASKSPEIVKRFDQNVFSDDFFLAVQFCESRFDKNAKSDKGAQGNYQITPVATRSAVEMLHLFRKRGILRIYRGPEKISLKMAKRIGNLFKVKPEYNEAVAKIFFLYLYDQISPLNCSPNKDVFRGKSVEERQRLLLYSYNAGQKYRFKQPLKGSRTYARNVFRYMKTIRYLRAELEKLDISKTKIKGVVVKFMRKAEEENFSRECFSRLLATID